MTTPLSAARNDRTISVDDLADLLSRRGNITILDVRPAGERDEWFIPDSVHVDAYEALKRNDPDALAGIDLPDDQLIVAVCGAGKTSVTAAEQLRLQGKRAVSLAGGMKAWSLAYNIANVPVASTSAEVVQVRRTGKGCLSYAIGAGAEAAVIDAALPPEEYVRLAESRGWRIVHVFDTHIHADHFSRSRSLADLTGAILHLPRQERVAFGYEPADDGSVVSFRGAGLKVLRTPGHTGESTCYLLDEAAVFTGDTLFTSGVGRPDLEASIEEARSHASELYDSLQRLRREVPPEALVLPGHTSQPVPFDGRAITDTVSGVYRRISTVIRGKETFVEYVMSRIPPTPPNYERIVALNESGTAAPDGVLDLEAGANRCAIS